MITSYIFILCLSTWMLVAGLSQAAKRVAKLLGPSAAVSPALCVLLPILGFFMVVAAAPPMVVAALVLLVVQVAARDRAATLVVRFGVPALAALLAASSVHVPESANLPSPVMVLGAAALLMAMAVGAERLPLPLGPMSVGVIAALVPLLAAPFMGAPSYIALDVALMVSGLLGALMAVSHATPCAAARAPFAILVGWLIIESFTHGAWVPALLSLAVYGGAIAYGLMRRHDETEHYAL